MMYTESSSELRPVDALGILMGFYVSIPPIGYRTRKLVRGYQHLLMVVSLHHLQLLLNRLDPIISIDRLHGIRKDWRLSALKISQPISQRRWHLGCACRLTMVCCMVQIICACIASTCSRVIEGGWRVGILVVVLPIVFSIVGGDMVLCVGHMKHEY
jgi:hypothetical protein